MPDRSVNVTIALPLADELHDTIRTTDRRLNVTALTRAQRRVYRDGRPLWAGYPEPPRAEDESEEEARERLRPILRGRRPFSLPTRPASRAAIFSPAETAKRGEGLLRKPT